MQNNILICKLLYAFLTEVILLQHKHQISANKIKVFISSSMNDAVFLEQRCAIKSFLDRVPLYDCFIIETAASPTHVITRYETQVQRSDIIILILQTELRPGVVKEFNVAKNYNKRIFAYIHNGTKTSDLEDFIKDKIHPLSTSTTFSDTMQLIDKIEHDLLEDLVTQYVELYQRNQYLEELLKKVSTAGTGHSVTP